MRAAARLVCALAAAGPAAACDDYVVGENLDASDSPDALFAVAYLDRESVREDDVAWRINPTVGLVIGVSATGRSVDLSRLRVASVDDDSPRVDVSFTIEDPADYRLPAGTAGGRLASGDRWIDPLVPEPRWDDASPSLQYRLDYLDPPPHSFDALVHATVVLAVDDQQATLPFVIEVRSSGPRGGPLGARRVRSVATPP